MSETQSRAGRIIRTSIIGIAANVALAAFKAVVGLLSHSIAVVLDAVNNLSDALSSVITIIGTRLSGKAPDREHPYGHGRVEYVTAAIIAMLVLYAGITAMVESVKSILHPETPDYSAVTLVVIAAAVVVKLLLGRFVKRVGVETHSDSLVGSGEDARMDAIISASTLVAAVIFLTTGLSLEAWLGLVISALIIKSGVELLRGTLSQVLGERVDSNLAKGIKEAITAVPGVQGAYDLILHDYGPDRRMGSVHIEVPETMTAREIDQLTRTIQHKVFEEQGVILTAVGIYAWNTDGGEQARLRDEIRRIVTAHDGVLQMHGFYMDPSSKTIRFDIVVDFIVKDREALHQQVIREVEEMLPGWQVSIFLDSDISD